MKVEMHERSGKPELMTLRAKPMSVWLTRNVQIIIEKGDKLETVARSVAKYSDLGPERSLQLAAFWFALGERAESGNPDRSWSQSELRVSAGRRYLDRR